MSEPKAGFPLNRACSETEVSPSACPDDNALDRERLIRLRDAVVDLVVEFVNREGAISFWELQSIFDRANHALSTRPISFL